MIKIIHLIGSRSHDPLCYRYRTSSSIKSPVNFSVLLKERLYAVVLCERRTECVTFLRQEGLSYCPGFRRLSAPAFLLALFSVLHIYIYIYIYIYTRRFAPTFPLHYNLFAPKLHNFTLFIPFADAALTIHPPPSYSWNRASISHYTIWRDASVSAEILLPLSMDGCSDVKATCTQALSRLFQWSVLLQYVNVLRVSWMCLQVFG
jgi:hypothetical protein